MYGDVLRIAAELDGVGNVVSRFVYAQGINVPETMVKGSSTYRLVKDQLGSVRLVVDVATGSVAQRIDYDAWGKVLQDTNPGFQPFGFAGGLYDAQSGLVRFGSRDYDPEVGRWTSKDPMRLGDGPNAYEYARSDPINLRDPFGTQTFGDVLCHVGGWIVEGFLDPFPPHLGSVPDICRAGRDPEPGPEPDPGLCEEGDNNADRCTNTGSHWDPGTDVTTCEYRCADNGQTCVTTHDGMVECLKSLDCNDIN